MKTQEELLNLAKDILQEAMHMGFQKTLAQKSYGLSNDEQCLVTNYSLALIKLLNGLFADEYTLKERNK